MNEGPVGLRRVGLRLRERGVVVGGWRTGAHRAVAALLGRVSNIRRVQSLMLGR